MVSEALIHAREGLCETLVRQSTGIRSVNLQ